MNCSLSDQLPFDLVSAVSGWKGEEGVDGTERDVWMCMDESAQRCWKNEEDG